MGAQRRDVCGFRTAGSNCGIQADTTGPVDTFASTGIVDFAGSQGMVTLRADGEIGGINLYLITPRFESTVWARAEGDIRVLMPSGFATGAGSGGGPGKGLCEPRALNMRCRSEMRDGKAVFTYGSGEPSVRLESVGGPVILDSADSK